MTALSPLKIGQHLAQYPIIQGGMGIRISGANLAAAVANSGGIGTISAVGLGMNSPYFDPTATNPKQRQIQFAEANRLALIDELNKARFFSPDGILAVNIMVAARDYETLVQTAAHHGANLIISGAGLPLNLPQLTQATPDVALVPIVSSSRAAQLICRKWQKSYGRLPDAFIVEDPHFAGGHLGAKVETLGQPEVAIASVIPALLAYLHDDLEADIPVIAAGGIWDRSDIERALALGASGVQIGTRFITTDECDADIRYKEFHLQAEPEDVVLVPSPVGLPGRALRNAFADTVLSTGTPNPKGLCLANCLQVCKFRDRRETYCILKALDRAARGEVETGLVFAGSNAGRAEKIVSVAELMAELTADAM
ncbi:NAD(P)H-dependent flavin oxidoreductase [Almyronema epifaneia]|uniref:NAD(P)H-dependent flavin oxidoreductase n=1 Tax=Almyronema epifaneia S1 TaxID=2991925 RepID=A0ABW6IB75_9CYAN